MNLSRRGLLQGFLGLCAAAPIAKLEPVLEIVLPVIQSKGLSAFSLIQVQALLRAEWSDQKIQNLVYEANPFLALIPKETT